MVNAGCSPAFANFPTLRFGPEQGCSRRGPVPPAVLDRENIRYPPVSDLDFAWTPQMAQADDQLQSRPR